MVVETQTLINTVKRCIRLQNFLKTVISRMAEHFIQKKHLLK